MLADAQQQIASEHHHHDLLDSLDAAEEIFAQNGRTDRLWQIAVCRPTALLARGDRASAVAASLRAYGDQTMSASLRLKAGTTALLAIGLSEDRHEAKAHVDGFVRLCEQTALDEDVLAAHAAVAQCKLFAALAEAGVPTAYRGFVGPSVDGALESIRYVATELWYALEATIRAAGLASLAEAIVPLTIALLRSVASHSVDVPATFALARQAGRMNAPVSALLAEGRAYALRGEHARAAMVLKSAIGQAKAGAVLHLQSAAHFELAMALMQLGELDRAWMHVSEYCSILQAKLDRSIVRVAALMTGADPPSGNPVATAASLDSVRHVQPEPPYLKRARRFVETHLRDDLSVESIVAASGVSRRSLELAFRTLRGVSPVGYLRQMRLEKAHKLLLNTELSFSEIREEVGYRNASVFSRDFRGHFGVSPLSVRRNARAESD